MSVFRSFSRRFGIHVAVKVNINVNVDMEFDASIRIGVNVDVNADAAVQGCWKRSVKKMWLFNVSIAINTVAMSLEDTQII